MESSGDWSKRVKLLMTEQRSAKVSWKLHSRLTSRWEVVVQEHKSMLQAETEAVRWHPGVTKIKNNITPLFFFFHLLTSSGNILRTNLHVQRQVRGRSPNRNHFYFYGFYSNVKALWKDRCRPSLHNSIYSTEPKDPTKSKCTGNLKINCLKICLNLQQTRFSAEHEGTMSTIFFFFELLLLNLPAFVAVVSELSSQCHSLLTPGCCLSLTSRLFFKFQIRR